MGWWPMVDVQLLRNLALGNTRHKDDKGIIMKNNFDEGSHVFTEAGSL